MATPILTIAVPSYNVEDYLAGDLETYCDERLRGRIEVIVVDDGSVDATGAIGRSFVRREPAIFRLLSKDNGGHGSAINAALADARGRYFRVVDADDWVETDSLVRLVELLGAVDTDLVVDVKREVDMATRAARLFPLPDDVALGEAVPFEGVCAREDLTARIMVHTLTVRTAHLRACGLRLPEHTFYEDFEYVVKATIDARDVSFHDLVVYNYLVGNAAQSVSDDQYVRRFDDHARVATEICDLYGRRRDGLSRPRRDYLRRRAALICNTHYNIALLFDKDRSRGLARARAFRAWLRQAHPEIAALTERRYRSDRVLHALGVDSQATLDRLTRRGGRATCLPTS